MAVNRFLLLSLYPGLFLSPAMAMATAMAMAMAMAILTVDHEI
jgi:hypothetical protein